MERRDKGGFWIRYTTDKGRPEFWNEVEWSADYVRRIEQGPIVIEDISKEAWLDPVRDQLIARGVASSVDVPLFSNGVLSGVLWFNSASPRTWGEHDVSVLADVAGQLAIVLASARAREERLVAERDLRSRDAILQAVSRSAERFLVQRSVNEGIVELMRVLGEATGVTSAYVFENVERDGPSTHTRRRAGWASGRSNSTVDDPRLAHVQPAPHFPRWAEVLGRGDVVSSHICDLPDDEREALELAGSFSVLAVPIFVNGGWWGFIGFEDAEHERDWSLAETEALRAAAGIVAAAIKRDAAEGDLRRRDAVLEAVSHGAERLVAATNWRDAAPRFLQELGEASGASRAYLFENGLREDGLLIASQRIEWSDPAVVPQLDNEDMQDMCYEEVGLGRLAELGARNEVFTGKVRELPSCEREFFEVQEIKSLMTVPIFVGDDWWGFIGFDDCTTEREWSPAEVDALRTTSSLIAAAIERELSEATLREQEQKLRAVFDTALDAIFITDDDRRYVDVNPAAASIGVAKRDLIGRRIDDFLPPSSLATLDEDWAAYLQGGPILAEWETQRTDGIVRRRGVGAPELRPRSAHRFLPRHHRPEAAGGGAPERAEARKPRPARGSVAHDFNNLLTGITGYASLSLERAGDDVGARARPRGNQRAADRAAELTKQLLAFGRRQMLKPRPLDLNAVVAEVGALLQRLLGDHVELEILAAPGLGHRSCRPRPDRAGDRQSRRQRPAMPCRDGGKLTIRDARRRGRFRRAAVSDTGLGMDEQTRAQVFEPFFTTREQGVGLGLASVYGIVQQSGGDVTVESARGAGSTFTVRLPRVLERPWSLALLLPPARHPGRRRSSSSRTRTSSGT